MRVLAQALMETEVSAQIGAGPQERSSSRTAYRDGYRTRAWDTRVVPGFVLPAVLPHGNAQDNTEQHDRPWEGLLTWTGRHEAALHGQGNTEAVRLIIRRSEVRVLPAPQKPRSEPISVRRFDSLLPPCYPTFGNTNSGPCQLPGDAPLGRLRVREPTRAG